MRFDRMHVALLSVISIFTGIIAPGIQVGASSIPLPMTNTRELAIVILFVLAFMFYFAIERKWKLYHLTAAIVTLIIAWILLTYFRGQLESLQGRIFATGLSWGWIFLGVGVAGFFIQTKSIFSQRNTDEDAIGIFEHMMAIFGALTLLGLASIILFVSLYSGPKKSHSPITNMYGTGDIIELTGAKLSPILPTMPTRLSYDRKNNIMSYIEGTGGAYSLRHSGGNFSTGIYEMIKPIRISETAIVALVSTGGQDMIIRGNDVYPLDEYLSRGNSILGSGSSGWSLWGATRDKMFSYSGAIARYRANQNEDTILWTTAQSGTVTIIKNGDPILSVSGILVNESISKSGYDSMALIQRDGKYEIYKNGFLTRTEATPTIKSSWVSNGSHYLYFDRKQNHYRVNFDGEIISKDLDEVREVFLDENGGSYAFFGRPVGETKWCLFTRYRGNLCGLDGYMNPRLGADGGSVIYAGYRDGNWKVYRNADVVVENTGYKSTTISKDYFFVDTTNPKKFVFYIYDRETTKYSIIKNGVLLPEVWDDVGIDVSFGDGGDTIITSVMRNGVWHIAEL